MEKLLYFLILILSLGQLGRFVVIREDIRIQLNDVVVFLVALLFIRYINIKKLFVKWFWGVIFTLWLLLSWLVNISNYDFGFTVIGFFYWLRYLVYFLLFIGAYEFLSKNKYREEIAKKVINCFIISGTFTAVVGVLQLVFFNNLLGVKGEWDPHVGRVFGTFFDPTYIGIILVLTLTLINFKLLAIPLSRNYISTQWKWILLFLVNYVSMLLTYSRISYLLYFLLILIILGLRKNFKYFAGMLLLFIISLCLLPKNISYGTQVQRQETIVARWQNWQEGFKIFSKSPIIGIGFNNLRYERLKNGNDNNILESNAASGIDNSYIFVLVTAGLIGLLLYLLFLKRLTFGVWYISKDNKMRESLIAMLAIGLFSGILSNSLFYPFIWEWILLCLVVGFSLNSKASN